LPNVALCEEWAPNSQLSSIKGEALWPRDRWQPASYAARRMERVDLGPCEADLDRNGARCRVIILPGAHYSAQAPLLWFAREVALSQGADVLSVRHEMPAQGDPLCGRVTVR
jgi:hypothetical protein